MSVVIFGVGVLVFFLTIYGTIVAGGIQLTRQQLVSSPELTPGLPADGPDPVDGVSVRDVIRADF